MLKTSLDIYLRFFCRSTHQYKNGENPIILRIIYRGQRRDIFTGISCPLKYWSSEMGLVSSQFKSAANINRNLMDIQAKAQQAFNLILLKGEEFSIEELVEAIKGKTPVPLNITEYIFAREKELENSIGVSIKRNTYLRHVRTIRYLKDFIIQQKISKGLPISKVNEQFLIDFFSFLMKEKKNSHNSAQSLMSCLRSILMPAIKNHTIKINPFMNVKFVRKKVIRDFLEMDEIETLQKIATLSPSQKLVRDIFLFTVFTGLSFSDIKGLNKSHIKRDVDGSYFIQLSRKKTGVECLIPLLPVAIKILKQYSYTEDFRDFVWKIPSNTTLNKQLKRVAKNAGISKRLFMHLGRHTFATTVTLSNDISLESVSKMLGQSSIRHTQIYAKIVGSKVKREMRNLNTQFS